MLMEIADCLRSFSDAEGNHPVMTLGVVLATADVEAMKRGLRLWGNLFATRLVAGLITMLCLFLLVIPGLVCAVKYAFLDMAVVLEDKQGSRARKRSWDLTTGHGIMIVAVCTMYYAMWICLVAALAFPLEILNETIELTDFQYYSIDVVITCIGDVFLIPLTAILYCMYLHASGQDTETFEESEPDINSSETLPPLDTPTGDNPYQPLASSTTDTASLVNRTRLMCPA